MRALIELFLPFQTVKMTAFLPLFVVILPFQTVKNDSKITQNDSKMTTQRQKSSKMTQKSLKMTPFSNTNKREMTPPFPRSILPPK
jgi:hypothetical protein